MATTVKNHVVGRDTAIDYPGPVDEFTPTTVLDNTVQGATCLFRIFDNDKTAHVIVAETRLRTAMAAAATLAEIPIMLPQIHEDGDTIELDLDDGTVHETTVASYDATGASNDEITLTAGIPAGRSMPIGGKIRLTKKAATATVFPVEHSRYIGDVVLEQGDALEMETDTIGTFDGLIVDSLQRLSTTEAVGTGDVATAINQPLYDLIITTAGSSNVISAGRQIRQKIGSDVTMAEYDDANGLRPAGSEDWGFKGVIPDTYDLKIGMTLLVEIRFTGNGGGLNDKVSFLLPVVGG